jgi:hypothetical protein
MEMMAATRDHTDTTGHIIATPPVCLLAISGSLRVASSNTALLRAVAQLAPVGVEIDLYERLAGLPHFNPDLDDLDRQTAPPEVLDSASGWTPPTVLLSPAQSTLTAFRVR